MSDLPRPPFKMLPSRGAQARYTFIDKRGHPRSIVRSGRASFVWLWYVLVPLATGSTPYVQIRQASRGRQEHPWHTVVGCNEAFAQLVKHYPLQRSIVRMVERRRESKGLSTQVEGGNDA